MAGPRPDDDASPAPPSPPPPRLPPPRRPPSRPPHTHTPSTAASVATHTLPAPPPTSLAAAVAGYAPPQHPTPAVIDFRCAKGLQPRGYLLARKRKRTVEEEDAMVDAAPTATTTTASGLPPRRVRAKQDVTGLGKGSGRAWKEPAQRASALGRGPTLSTDWATKMALKAQKAAFTAAKIPAYVSPV